MFLLSDLQSWLLQQFMSDDERESSAQGGEERRGKVCGAVRLFRHDGSYFYEESSITMLLFIEHDRMRSGS